MTEITTVNYVQKVIDRLDELIPGNDSVLIDLYALLVLTTGEETTLKDVHDAWSVWRNLTKPDHKSLILFELLTPEIQEYDRKYMEAIHQVAREIAATA